MVLQNIFTESSRNLYGEIYLKVRNYVTMRLINLVL